MLDQGGYRKNCGGERRGGGACRAVSSCPLRLHLQVAHLISVEAAQYGSQLAFLPAWLGNNQHPRACFLIRRGATLALEEK